MTKRLCRLRKYYKIKKLRRMNKRTVILTIRLMWQAYVLVTIKSTVSRDLWKFSHSFCCFFPSKFFCLAQLRTVLRNRPLFFSFLTWSDILWKIQNPTPVLYCTIECMYSNMYHGKSLLTVQCHEIVELQFISLFNPILSCLRIYKDICNFRWLSAAVREAKNQLWRINMCFVN